MPNDPKIIDLRQRRAEDALRRRAQAEAARAANRRRQLAEHGPAASRAGRIVGMAGSALLWATILAGVVAVIWKHLH